MRFPQPPRKLELQRLLYPAGRPIYKDVDGVNEQDKYFVPDNVEGRKLRPIQTGRVYNFTGVEWTKGIEEVYESDVTSIKGSAYIKCNSSGSVRIIQAIDNGGTDRVFQFRIDATTGYLKFIIIGSSVVNHSIDIDVTDEEWHYVAYDYNLGTSIILTLDTTISQLLTTQLPLTQKIFELGIGVRNILTTLDDKFVGQMYNVSYEDNFSSLFYYCDDQSGLVARDALTVDGNNGVIDLGGSPESSFHATDPEVPSRQNEVGHWFSGDAVGVGALTPIAEDGNGKTDVLGNTVPHPYFGEVRKEALLTNASCMNFDGNLVLTFSDLSGRSIVDQEGDVTLEISGNNIQPVSGTGVVWYLEFDNGSYYRGSEVNGLTVWDLNTSNALDGTWDLLGSSDGDQYGDSEFARPNNILDGFTKAGYFDGVRYVDTTSVTINDVDEIEFTFYTNVEINSSTSPPQVIAVTNLVNVDWIVLGNWNGTLDDEVLSFRFIEGSAKFSYIKTPIPKGTNTIKIYFDTDRYRIELNGVLQDFYGDTGISTQPAWEGIIGKDEAGSIPFFGLIINWRVLGSNGELFYDFISGNETLVPNTSLSAPVNSNAIWSPADNGKYTDIPADPANKGFDVTGGVLGVKGSTIALNPSESKIIFNPYGDPGLHAMGLTHTIELGYADIVANESIFHDNRVANKVEKLLAYSDFQYPVLGSSFQSDGNITISHPSIATNGIVQFEGTAEYVINGDTLELTAGLIYILVVGDGTYTYFPEEKGLVVYDYAKSGINFTINLNGSPDGDQWLLRSNKYVESGVNLNINLRYGRYDNGISLIPGDFANFGFDILGNPIDNMEEVIKYRRIRQFLRK